MTPVDQMGAFLTGVDVQSVSSFSEHSGAVAEGLRERVFTHQEREYCESTARPSQHYAARWAAKEAFIKLVPEQSSVHYGDIEVGRDGSKPVYVLTERPAEVLCRACGVTQEQFISLSLSLSHDCDADVAIAHASAISRGEFDAR